MAIQRSDCAELASESAWILDQLDELIGRRDDGRGRTSEEFSGFRSVSYRSSPEGSLHTPSASLEGLAPVGEKLAPVVSGDTGTSAAQRATVIDMISFARPETPGSLFSDSSPATSSARLNFCACHPPWQPASAAHLLDVPRETCRRWMKKVCGAGSDQD